MKKTSKRLSDFRYPSSNTNKSKNFISLRPQRVLTSPSEHIEPFLHSNNIQIDAPKTRRIIFLLMVINLIGIQTDESTSTSTLTPEEAGFSDETRAYIWAVIPFFIDLQIKQYCLVSFEE